MKGHLHKQHSTTTQLSRFPVLWLQLLLLSDRLYYFSGTLFALYLATCSGHLLPWAGLPADLWCVWSDCLHAASLFICPLNLLKYLLSNGWLLVCEFGFRNLNFNPPWYRNQFNIVDIFTRNMTFTSFEIDLLEVNLTNSIVSCMVFIWLVYLCKCPAPPATHFLYIKTYNKDNKESDILNSSGNGFQIIRSCQILTVNVMGSFSVAVVWLNHDTVLSICWRGVVQKIKGWCDK